MKQSHSSEFQHFNGNPFSEPWKLGFFQQILLGHKSYRFTSTISKRPNSYKALGQLKSSSICPMAFLRILLLLDDPRGGWSF